MINRAVAAQPILVFGGAVTRNNPKSSGGIAHVNRWDTVGRSGSGYDPIATGFNNSYNFVQQSWSTTGINVLTTGTVIFNNRVNGGSLSSVIVANRGPDTAFINFNSLTAQVSGSISLASGESMRYDRLIIDQIAATAQSTNATITAQGIYRSVQ